MFAANTTNSMLEPSEKLQLNRISLEFSLLTHYKCIDLVMDCWPHIQDTY